jgi:hypothetical protein
MTLFEVQEEEVKIVMKDGGRTEGVNIFVDVIRRFTR